MTIERQTISVISTVYNEADSIGALLDSLAKQTRRPDEVVVADAGSTDGTRAILEASTMTSLRVINAPGNRSAGRNAAIAASTGDLIASIDGGCVADPEWLDRLLGPFETGASWVAGFYRINGPTSLATCIGLVMVYVEEELKRNEEVFIPSARSVAFTRRAWEEVGGFPDHVEFAEDTLFGNRLLAAGHQPALALDAVVQWTPPPNLRALFRTAYRWGAGDADAGIRGWVYKRILLGYGGAALFIAAALPLWPEWAWLGALAVLIDTLRRTRFKFRLAPKPAGWVLVPIAHLVSTYGALIGFLSRYRGRGD